MLDNMFPFLNDAMDSFLVKINILRSKEIIKGALPQFPRFYPGETPEGAGRSGNRMGKVRGMGRMGS